MSSEPECTQGFQFALGVSRSGRVCIDFMRPVGIFEMTPEVALKLAEGLVDTALQASRGIQIPTPGLVRAGMA